MRRPMFTLLLILLVAAVASEGLAAGPTAKTSPAQVRYLVDRLNHDDYTLRERAATGLVLAGPSAIAPLAEGVVSENPEVAWRSSEVLQRIALEGDEATLDTIVTVLNDLAKRGKPGLAQLATEMRERQRAFRHNRAAIALRKLGGTVGGMGMSEEAEIFGEVAMIDAAELEAEGIEVEPDIVVGEAPEVADLVEVPDDAVPADEKPDDEKPAGGVAGAIGRALFGIAAGFKPKGEGIAEAIAAAEDVPAPAIAVPEFRIPLLERAAEEVVIDEDGADAVIVADDLVFEEEIGVDVAFAAPLFIGGVFPADGGSQQVMWLNKTWRGGDAGLKHLQDLSGVETIQIDSAQLSDAALPHIAKMTSLKHLQIRGGKFSTKALRKFHADKPNVSIMALGEGMMGVNGRFDAGACLLDVVFPGSAAADAGLVPGDIVTAIDGEKIRDFSELTISVSNLKPGDKFKVAIKRGEEQQEVEVTLKPRGPGQ